MGASTQEGVPVPVPVPGGGIGEGTASARQAAVPLRDRKAGRVPGVQRARGLALQEEMGTAGVPVLQRAGTTLSPSPCLLGTVYCMLWMPYLCVWNACVKIHREPRGFEIWLPHPSAFPIGLLADGHFI